MVQNRSSQFGSLVFLGSIVGPVLILAIACGPAPKAPVIVDSNPTPSTKPNSVSATQVSLAAMTELSHLERAIKPFIGVATSGVVVAPALTETVSVSALDMTDCRVTASTNKTMWETRWTCGLKSTESGKKEIEGVERVNYDLAKRTLTYSGDFETRNFDDREARANAHTLSTSRRITIVFSGEVTSASTTARVRMVTGNNLKRSDIERKGSAWSSTLEGTISRSGTTWVMKEGATIRFRGALYGLDQYRYTNWAAGDFDFVSETVTNLSGLGDATCTKPIGVWKIDALGAGQKFDTKLETNLTGGQTRSGGSFTWPSDLCEQP